MLLLWHADRIETCGPRRGAGHGSVGRKLFRLLARCSDISTKAPTCSLIGARLLLSGLAWLPQDFSEDTYRTLAAADNAVMLVDAAKGLEPQTRKLFEVKPAKKRRRGGAGGTLVCPAESISPSHLSCLAFGRRFPSQRIPFPWIGLNAARSTRADNPTKGIGE